MRGSWKGLFYLKEGKKCTSFAQQKAYQMLKNAQSKNLLTYNRLIQKRLQKGLAQVDISSKFVRSVRNSKFFTILAGFFRMLHKAKKDSSPFPTMGYCTVRDGIACLPLC